LHHRIVGEPPGAARGLAQCQFEEGVEYAAGDAETDAGDADRIEGLLREGVERTGLAPQARVLANSPTASMEVAGSTLSPPTERG